MADKRRWLFDVKVHDRPGTLTAVSCVFSNRGVSVQMLLGSTLHAVAPDAIDLFFVFEAAEPRKNELLRAMGRLANVISVRCLPYGSPRLRAVAFAHVDPGALGDATPAAALADDDSVAFAAIAREDQHETWVFTATPDRVRQCLDRLRDAGALLDTTVTIIPVE